MADDYERTKRRIQRSQQIFQFKLELVFTVILLGVIINILSSSIYDIIKTNYFNSIKITILSIIILGIVLFLIRHFLIFESHITILKLSYDPFLPSAYDDVITKNIRARLKDDGLTRRDYDLWFKQFQKILKKILEGYDLEFLGKKDIKSVNEYNGDSKNLSVDISSGKIQSEMIIYTKMMKKPPIFLREETKIGEFYSIEVEVEFRLNNPENEEALDYFELIYKKKEYLSDLFKGIILIPLALKWDLFNDTFPYDVVKYFGLDNLK